MGYTKGNFERMFYGVLGIALCAGILCPLAATAQEVLFYDDFSGDLSNWQELGNAGIPQIVDGQLQQEWGYAPNWFVTKDSFDPGENGMQFDIYFADGGQQAAANYKVMNMQPLLGATDPNAENGGVIATFSYQDFSLMKRTVDADGNPAWTEMRLSKNTSSGVRIETGSRIRIEVNSDGLEGGYFVDGRLLNKFSYAGDPLEGGMGFRSVVQRNLKVDDVRFYQVDANGDEEILLEDDFSRTDLGSEWVNETLADDTAPGAMNAHIEDGELWIENDGSGDTWLRTAQQVSMQGKTTVFEFTFVDYLGSVVYNPSVIVGTKPFATGETSGVMLFDNGAGFDYAMEGGAWTSGRVRGLSGIGNGMRFKVEIDPGAQSGRTYRNGIEISRFKTLGPELKGGFAFRSIADRDASIDDLRIYTVDENGNETTFFEDNFNRDQLGDDWVVEAITPGGWVEALIIDVFDEDGDGDNELYLDHDETLEDNWCRLKKDLPFGDRKVVIEGTYAFLPNGYPSIVIGTEEWKENETIGPMLLDNIETAWGMDARGGNVWVRNGPVAGTKVSLVVNAGGRSGSLLTNDVLVTEWEMAPEEPSIPAGAVGIRDPFDAPQVNVEPASGNANAVYDDIRVIQLGTTSVTDWMIR